MEADFGVNLLSQQAPNHGCVYPGTKPLGMNKSEKGKEVLFFPGWDIFAILLLRERNNRGKGFGMVAGGWQQVRLDFLWKKKPWSCRTLVQTVPPSPSTRFCFLHPHSSIHFPLGAGLQIHQTSHKLPRASPCRVLGVAGGAGW